MDQIKKVLEMGVGDAKEMASAKTSHYQTGASLRMWRDFFPNALIFGADIESRMMFKTDRIETFVCDQSDKEDLMRLIDKTGSDIDLFVDDGSHIPEHQISTCLTLMPILKKDVIYVIEDISDLGILESFKDYDVYYRRFNNKSSWDDRMLIIKNKS